MATAPEPLKVLFVSSEVSPFAKTGGLGDVVGALPKALRRRGIDARVVTPLYAGMNWHELERLDGALSVPMWWGAARAGVRLGLLPGSDVPVYFLEHNRYFDRPHLYGPPGDEYGDNLERFAFLSRGALELSKAIAFLPDVVHAHDWQAALAPVYVNTVEWGQPLHGAASVYTIHNLAYQGVTDGGAMLVTGLGREHYNPREFEHFGALNLTKAVLQHATMLSTVSPTYAGEIQTSEHGCGLDGVLRGRSADLVGILNGVDVDDWDPATDPHIEAHFSATHMDGKEPCKTTLQLEAGLPADPRIPLFGAVGRLTHQKGFDVLAHCMERVLGWNAQFVLLGNGDRDAERFFGTLSARRPDKFKAWLGFDNGLAHRITAGSDFLVMPSRFEPCGLSQMYAMRYGTLPIVRATGGLVDTVQNYEEAGGAGTGFVFRDLSADALANTIGWALSTYHDRFHHVRAMRQRAMERDFSWHAAADAYVGLYLEAYRRRRGHAFAGRAPVRRRDV
jgi:starch synthase